MAHLVTSICPPLVNNKALYLVRSAPISTLSKENLKHGYISIHFSHWVYGRSLMEKITKKRKITLVGIEKLLTSYDAGQVSDF